MKKMVRKKPDPAKPAFVGDIARASTSKVLDLKKKLPAIQIDFGQVKEWWFEHQHKFFIILSILIGGLILSSFSTGHASVATFYPSSCLGDWEKVENATGEPSLPDESSPEQFSLENSARMPGSVSSIYCGSFKGSIPENSTPTKYKLTLSWAVDDGSIVHTTTTTTTTSPQPFETGTEDGTVTLPADTIEEGTDTVPADVPMEDTTTDTTQEIPVESAPAAPTPAPDTSSETSTEQSFLDLFKIGHAIAQETQPETVVDTAPAPEAPTEDVVDQTVQEAPSIDSGVSVPEQQVEQTIEEPVVETPADAFMEVEYTLDGSTWQTLGTISRSAWARASFDLPLESWESIDNLQIALKTLPSFDAIPVVYLDAMQVSVEYSEMKDLVTPPTVELTDPSEVISGKQDFNSTEAVTFDLTAPNLDTADLKALVDEGKATVVKDTEGVLGQKVADPEIKAQTDAAIDTIKDTVEETKDSIDQIPVTPPPAEPAQEPPVDINNRDTPATVSFFKRLFGAEIAHADESAIDAVVLDQNGETTNIPATIIPNTDSSGHQTYRVDIDQPDREFKPGRYTLVVTFRTPQAILVSRQDFTWGVLVANTDQSVYVPGDTAYIQMGVLNDAGHTICNADLELIVTSPSGSQTSFATSDGSIVRDAQCGPDNVISVPDYYTHFRIGRETGTYTMQLTAHTTNGTKTINDSFEVESTPAIDVARIGPSRIYPVALYPMTLKVTSPVDWKGTVSERVPASFEISQPEQSVPYDAIDEEGDTKVISWNVNLQAGESMMLGYYFDAPDVSPEIFILGAATFTSTSGAHTFEESRQWQIASDAACNATADGTWSTTANFINCTGAASAGSGTGNRPGVNDDLTINTGVNITADTTVTIKSLTFATLATGSPSLDVANGVTFTVSGTTVIPSAGSGSSSTITTGGGTSGEFITNGITINGSGSAGRNSILSIPAGGTFTTTNGITFAGTAGQARLNASAGGTINLTGTMSAGGTLSINAAATVYTTNTTVINNAATYGILSVDSGTTTLGAVATTFAGAVSVANGATLTVSSATGAKVFTGGVNVDTNGVFDLRTGSSFATVSTFGGDIVANGATFDSGGGAVTISGTGTLTLSGSSNISLGGTMTIPTNRTIVNSNTGTVTVGAITIASPTASNGLSLSNNSTTSVTGALAFTANAAAGNTQTVTMNGSANLTVGSISMPATTSTGTATIACASGATGTLTSNGAISITGSATASGGTSSIDFGTNNTACNLTANTTTTIAGGSTGVALLKMGTGTLTFTSNVAFGSSGNITRSQLTTDAATINILGGTFGASGTLSIASATLSTSGTTTISGTYTLPTLNVTSGTTIMGAAVTVTNATTVASGATLRFGAFAFTASGSTSVSGSIICTAAASCTGLKTFTGTVTVNSGGSIDFTTGSPTVVPTVRFDNDITMDGTAFATNTGAVTIGASLDLLGSNNITFGGTTTVNSGATLTNANGGTVTMGALTIASPTASNGVSLSTGSTTSVTGAISYTANATANTQELTLNGTANISSATLTINRPTTNGGQANITCASGATGTLSTSGATTINGASTATATVNVAINSCNFTSGGLLTIAGGSTGGNITVTTTSGVLTTSAGLSFSGTAARNVINIGTGNWNHTGTLGSGGTLTVDSGNTFRTTGTAAISGVYTLANFNVISGTTTLNGVAITFAGDTVIDGSLASGSATGLKTFTGNVTVDSGGSFNLSSFAVTNRFDGDISVDSAGTFATGTGAVTIGTSLALVGAGSMTFGGATTISSGVTLTNDATGVVDFNSNLLGGDASSTFATGANSTTHVAGTVMSTGVLVPSTSLNTIEYDGSTQTIKVPTTNPYYNLTVSAAGVKSLAGVTTVTGTTSITAGSIDTVNAQNYALNTGNLSIGASGTLTARNATITVTGDWTNAGTFTTGNSTVVLNSGTTATVTGSTAFYNLTITHSSSKEVDFEAGSTFDITNLLNVTGSSGNLIKLYSTVPTTQWIIHPTGTASVDYVEVKDGGCGAGSISISPTNFINSGNNDLCWAAPSLTFEFSNSDASIGFGTLSSGATRYATGDTLGDSSEVEAHNFTVTTTAPSGYTLSVLGDSLSTGAHTISAIGGSNTAPSVGTEQFGMRLTATGGSGSVSSPYAAPGFAYGATNSIPDEIASAASGDGVATTYSARYMCNISPITTAGDYSTSLTYILTGNF